MENKNQNSNQSLMIVIIIAIILIAIILCVAGYLAYKYYADKQSTPTPIVTVTQTISATPTSSLTSSSSPQPTSTLKSSITTDYVIEDSNIRKISRSELVGLTPWQLKVARNEIYARHGREFVHKDLTCYFNSKSWYKINPNFSESNLSTIENSNISVILNYEKEINSPLLEKDTGC